ncbi:hypothetical protein M413DRAFT_14521 [Hebeloma cylindrosporum]|uniref:Uncharacterized protein n=1 Tax=Hebeloma cylindrosporum TaxID=76867 RepID=A0A0C2XC60_HEBCY|nr:hypothetical protein M413DRAFT_14521 [Hebeloma cylindrosporum h7]
MGTGTTSGRMVKLSDDIKDRLARKEESIRLRAKKVEGDQCEEKGGGIWTNVGWNKLVGSGGSSRTDNAGRWPWNGLTTRASLRPRILPRETEIGFPSTAISCTLRLTVPKRVRLRLGIDETIIKVAFSKQGYMQFEDNVRKMVETDPQSGKRCWPENLDICLILGLDGERLLHVKDGDYAMYTAIVKPYIRSTPSDTDFVYRENVYWPAELPALEPEDGEAPEIYDDDGCTSFPFPPPSNIRQGISMPVKCVVSGGDSTMITVGPPPHPLN